MTAGLGAVTFPQDRVTQKSPQNLSSTIAYCVTFATVVNMTKNRMIASLAIASFTLVGVAVSTPIANATQSGIQEDDPAWSCVDDGNRICGPSNTEGKPAGCYDDGGVMVAAWPCYVVVNQAGDANVYTPDAR